MVTPRLFAIMPFGTRVVPHAYDGTLDFDVIYHDYLKRAAREANWSILRIDESAHPGLIADQYLRELATADLVIGDISLANANVFYELGVRHSISPAGTILIAHDKSDIPFDLASQRIIFYRASPDGLKRLEADVALMLRHHLPGQTSSPVYTFLERAGVVSSPVQDPAFFERDVQSKLERANSPDQLIGLWEWLRLQTPLPPVILSSLADRLASFERWEVAASVLRIAVTMRQGDFELHRQLAWCLSQLGPAHDEETTSHFQIAIKLNPRDPETLGMMASRSKRQGRFQEASTYFDQAAQVSQRSIYIEVNRAACRILASPAEPHDGLELYKRLKANILSTLDRPRDEWDELVLCECCFVAGEDQEAFDHCRAAVSLASSPKSTLSAARQLQLFADVGFRAEAAADLVRHLRSNAQAASDTPPAVQDPSSRPTLIHISDTHFGGITIDGKFVHKHRFFDGVNERSLLDHFRDELDSSTSPIKVPVERMHLICSGDFTYVGSKVEYDEALKFLNGLVASANLPKSRVHIVPGNHDINWALGRSDPSQRFDNYLAFVQTFYGVSLAAERFPLIKWPISLGDDRPRPWDIAYVCANSAHQMIVIGLNTCVYESEQHHFGFVGERQLQAVRKLVIKAQYPRDWFKVVVMHHHLHPLPELLRPRASEEPWLDMSILRDSGLVESYLAELGVDVLLHGHKHKPLLREVTLRDTTVPPASRRPLIVCGAGSVGCNVLEHAEANQYQVVEARRLPRAKDAEFIRVSWRCLPIKPGAEWTTSNTFSVLG